MAYQNLLRLRVGEDSDSGALYRAIRSKEDISPAGRAEFEKAKNLLSIVSSRSNISLADHLRAILQRVIRQGIEDAVDRLEEISLELKNEKRPVKSDIIEVTPPNEALLKYIEDKKCFYNLTPVVSKASIKTVEDEEAEEEERHPQKPPEEVANDVSEVNIAASISDLHFSMQRFYMAGIGLNPFETHELVLAMKNLVEKHQVEEVRFWGKVFTRTDDYYIVESKYNSEVIPEDFGWEVDETQKEEDENEIEEAEEKVSNEEAKLEGEEDKESEGDAEEEEAGPKIPPLPKRDPPKRRFVPSEMGGHGVNERLYFAATRVDGSWRCLPFLKPVQIVEARMIKRFFTGNLEAEIGGGIPFSGKEAHYLRAQIARITASTFAAPADYFELSEEDEDENPLGIAKNESFEPKTVMEMYAEGLEAWVHYKPAILDQGRCSPMQEGEEDEEEVEEEDEEGSERFEAKREIEVPKLRSLSEDEALGNLQPWSIRLSSRLFQQSSIMILRSDLWPGAFTFYDGRTFDHIYIGFGYKFSVYHYAPSLSIAFQQENESGSDILETEDIEVEDESPKEIEEGDNEEEGGDEVDKPDDGDDESEEPEDDEGGKQDEDESAEED